METTERTISPAMKAFLIHHYLREAVMELDAAYKAGYYRLARAHCLIAKRITATLCDFDIIGMATCCVLEEKLDYISRELNRRIRQKKAEGDDCFNTLVELGLCSSTDRWAKRWLERHYASEELKQVKQLRRIRKRMRQGYCPYNRERYRLEDAYALDDVKDFVDALLDDHPEAKMHVDWILMEIKSDES